MEESRHSLQLELVERTEEAGQLVLRLRAAEARSLEAQQSLERGEQARLEAEARLRGLNSALQGVRVGSRPGTPSRWKGWMARGWLGGRRQVGIMANHMKITLKWQEGQKTKVRSYKVH